MQIDFYHWGHICPISSEIITRLSNYKHVFDIQIHDITNDCDTAKKYLIFFPFLTVVNKCKRYYGPISDTFLKVLLTGSLPKENPYKIPLGKQIKCGEIQPITKSNYKFASHCTGRGECTGCFEKTEMYQGLPDGILGFMNIDKDILLGGVEYYPSLEVPYDIPKGKEIAFITCCYLSNEAFDYKTAPLKRLERYVSSHYQKIVVIADEEGTFPNGDLYFFEKNGYNSIKILMEDDYCKLHLLMKKLI